MKRYPLRNKKIIAWFRENAIAEKSELHYSSPFELIVAVILSAQCTDKRVNMVTPALLAVYPDAKAMAAASQEDIYKYIKSVSYPNSKADHLLKMSRMLLSDFKGDVPKTIEDLMRLPGVGRKTAGKICVELKDKVGQFAFAAGGASGGAAPMANDAVMALRALGFAEDASAKMVADVLAANPSVDSVGQVVKLALAGR